MSPQPKYNHLKEMSSRGIDRKQQKQKNYANHRDILPTPPQKNALKSLFVEEMKFYNNFIKLMQPRLKTSPSFYENIGERQKLLFVKLAQIGFNVRDITNRKSKNVVLPKSLEQYRDILFGITGDKEVGLNETLAVFYEICKHRAIVLSDTRKNMAYEFLNFYIKQTRSHDNMYTLEEVDKMQKRHIQLAKSQVTMSLVRTATEFGDETHTEIKIPQLKTPLIMDADYNDLQSWNIMIIHKDPSQLDLGNTNLNWEVDFRQTEDKYLLKYVETPNPIAKMNSRFIKK